MTETFGEWLKAQMELNHMGQRQLAARSGIHHTTIGRIIKEGHSTRLSTANALRAVFETPKLPLSTEEQFKRALDADTSLTPAQRFEIFQYYLRVRRSNDGVKNQKHPTKAHHIQPITAILKESSDLTPNPSP